MEIKCVIYCAFHLVQPELGLELSLAISNWRVGMSFCYLVVQREHDSSGAGGICSLHVDSRVVVFRILFLSPGSVHLRADVT